MNGDARIPQSRDVRTRMSSRLMAWAGASMLVAVALWVAMYFLGASRARGFVSALAAQCFIWGAVDAIFAGASSSHARRTVSTPDDPITASTELRDAANLVRVLRFSGRLNYVLLTIGLGLLIAGLGARSATLLGHGVGVLVQVGFLHFFDRAFLAAMTRATGANGMP